MTRSGARTHVLQKSYTSWALHVTIKYNTATKLQRNKQKTTPSNYTPASDVNYFYHLNQYLPDTWLLTHYLQKSTFYRPQLLLRKGNVFTSVYHSFCRGGGMRGEGGGMCGKGGRAWQERRPLQRTVRILLECILVKILLLRVKGERYSPTSCLSEPFIH